MKHWLKGSELKTKTGWTPVMAQSAYRIGVLPKNALIKRKVTKHRSVFVYSREVFKRIKPMHTHYNRPIVRWEIRISRYAVYTLSNRLAVERFIMPSPQQTFNVFGYAAGNKIKIMQFKVTHLIRKTGYIEWRHVKDLWPSELIPAARPA